MKHSSGLTGDRFGAAHAFLSVQVAEAFKAVGVVFPGGEALTRQLLSAADAQEALAVPGLVLVGHSTSCDGLGDDANQDKERMNVKTLFKCSAQCFYSATMRVTSQGSVGFSLTLPSYKHSTGRHIASRSRACRSSWSLLG